MVDPGDHVQQRGFAAARFTDNRDEFPAPDGQVDAFEDGKLPGRILERFDHPVHVDHYIGVAQDRFNGSIFPPGRRRFHFLRLPLGLLTASKTGA